ncbi:MAG: hypothetical protein AAGA56_05350 [Myxococcota bacterium]
MDGHQTGPFRRRPLNRGGISPRSLLLFLGLGLGSLTGCEGATSVERGADQSFAEVGGGPSWSRPGDADEGGGVASEPPSTGPHRWRLWLVDGAAIVAFEESDTGREEPANRLVSEPWIDIAQAGERGPIIAGSEEGVLARLDGSLRVDAWERRVRGLLSLQALEADEDWVYLLDRNRGLCVLAPNELGAATSPSIRCAEWGRGAVAITRSSRGLYLAENGAGRVTFIFAADWMAPSRRFSSPAIHSVTDLGYGPDGALYVTDGGPCVSIIHNPHLREGTIEPDQRFCRPGHAFRSILVTPDGRGYLAGAAPAIDVFEELGWTEMEGDHYRISLPGRPPRHVIRLVAGYAGP